MIVRVHGKWLPSELTGLFRRTYNILPIVLCIFTDNK